MLDRDALEKKLNGAERPELALAMELAALFHDEMDALRQSISVQINESMNMSVINAKRLTELDGKLKQFIEDSERNRHERANKELKEAEARLLIAKQQKDNLSTDEKIQANKMIDERLSARERERQEKTRARLEDLIWSLIKTAANVVVGVIALALFTLSIVSIARQLGLVVQMP